MSTPQNFALQPTSPQTRPPPAPPRFLKKQIYSDPKVFDQIDRHAVNEARTNYRNFRDLMYNLIFKKSFSDLEKARAIFRWMTTKNMYTIMFDGELPGSPEQVIGGFKDGKTTYARIFECLSCYAGLHCVTLSGWAKGVDYRPGSPITSSPINHSWNAVFIDGNWQLVDSHWATRYLQSEKNTPENLVYEYDDFYFVTEPGNLIYSHCPEDPAWQLCHPARPRGEYEEYPLVKSYFFTVGMQFLQQNQGVIYTRRGLITITLGYTQPTAFTFKLAYGDHMQEAVQGVALKRYIIQETTKDRVTFYFRAPREGNYYITVFAQHVGTQLKLENVFKAACEYKIVCEQAAGDIRPYPVCSDSNWGPGAPVEQYGLIPSHPTAIVSAPNGRADLSFTKTRDVRLYARLNKEGVDEETLEKCVTIREQDNQIFVTVQLPARGEYGLEVYANEPMREGDTFTHMCQYLASYTERDMGTLYGQVFDRNDLTHTMQATPQLYNVPEGQYTTQPYEVANRAAPTESYAAQPYDPRAGPRGPGADRQLYETSSKGWDGNAFTQSKFREETQTSDDGRSYRSSTTADVYANNQPGAPGKLGSQEDMSSRMESVTIGGKKAPVTAPKPGQRGYGDESLPPPPSDMMDQAYQQQQHRAPGEDMGQHTDSMGRPLYGSDRNQRSGTPEDDASRKPIEIVYINSPKFGRKNKEQEDEANQAAQRSPIEIVYVSGSDRQHGRDPTDDKYDVNMTIAVDGSKPDSNDPTQEVPTKAEESRRAALAGSRIPPGGPGGHGLPEDDLPPPPPTSDPPYDSAGRTPGQAGYTPGQYGTGKNAPGQYGPGQNAPGQYGPGQYGTGPNAPGQYSTGPNAPGQNPPGQYGTGQNAPGQYGSGPNAPGQYGTGPNAPGQDRYGQKPYGRGQDPHAPQQPQSPGYNTQYHFGEQPTAATYNLQRMAEPEQEYTPHPQKTYTSSITIAPPTSFKPIPIYQHQDTPKPAPPEVPPKPFKDTSIFQNVDTHAVQVSKEDHKSFRELVWHLIYAREITNELEKARAIFLWLCSMDLSELHFDDITKGSPEEIMMSLKQGKTTYAVVFETLCSYAGLHCKTVSGYAKGAEYKPGMKFTGEQGQHSWNGVLVNGAWRLVDCHWAARRLVGKKVTPENVRYELDEYYFMPDPHQLIFTHFPDDQNWQLLERFISLADFENLVPVKSAFFKYGLQILSHREAVIHTKREVTIRVGCPPFKASTLAFTFTLAFDDGREEHEGVKLNRYGMQEMVDSVSFFTIRPPDQGGYRLIIYAKDLETTSKEGVYGGVCEYEVMCESRPPRPQPFPPCVHTSWGPGDSATKYGLSPLQSGAIFSTVNGLAEVKFRMPKDLRFTAKLKSADQDEKALQGFIMHRIVADVAIFTITTPQRGEYGLEIYANDPESDGNSLFHAYQYLLICTETKGPVEPLPTLAPGYLGPQPAFKKLGLSTLNHHDPYIQIDSGDLQVAFEMSQPLRMTSQLIYVTGGKTEECSEYIMQQSRGEQSIFIMKLPKIGMYKLQTYALPYSDTSESLPGVYNYLVNCLNTYSTLTPFPKQYGQWKEGCFLHEPLEGQISPNRSSKGSASSFQYVYFKLDVPKANAVAVVVGEEWTQLEKKTTTAWEGEVFMEKHWGREPKCAICANYGGVKASYSTLLEYSL